MKRLQVPQGSAYDPELAKELLLLVQKAHEEFDRSEREPDWNWDTDRSGIIVSGKEYKIRMRFGFAEYLFTLSNILQTDLQELGGLGRDRVPFGFVAEDDKNNIYIVFRGTTTPAEWFTNFQFKPGNDPFLGQPDLGKVHRGFYKIYTRSDKGTNPRSKGDDLPAIKDTIEKTITGCPAQAVGAWPKEAIAPCPTDATVYVTGHSLGGALATLATLHIQEINHFQKSPILYAFANPRVGDLAFYDQFNAIQSFRVANSEDIVPTVPLASVELTSDSSNERDITSSSLNELKPHLLSSVLADLDYHHVGEPIYFTYHKGSIADNHIIPTYKEALGI